MTPQEIIELRAKQIEAWITSGHITREQVLEIQTIWSEGENNV